MRISSYTNNSNQAALQRKNSVSFGEGKASFYADFDRTYLPATHKGFESIRNESQAPELAEYFENFRIFLNNTRAGLKFTITTGRNFAEFETMAEIARARKFDMPLPDTLIVKNGSDEHIRIRTDEEFYAGGKFPFAYDVTNKQKEEDLKKATGWDGPKIKSKLKELFISKGFDVREYPTTNSASDYGEKSALYELNDSIPNIAVLRQDGNLKLFYTSVNETEGMDKRTLEVDDEFRTYLRLEKIDFAYKNQGHDREFANLPTENYSPKVGHGSNGLLTKLYDTQQAVKKALLENDLVVVAGDSSNDFQMLNPFNYLKEEIEKDKEYNLRYLIDRPSDMIEEMEKRPELAKKFQELPFVGIVVKNKDKQDTGLEDLIKHFGEGKYKKIIAVDEGNLLDGVKQAIKMHADNKPEYKTKLSADLKKEIYGCEKEIPKVKGKLGWIIAGVAALGTILGGIYYEYINQRRAMV